MVEAYIFIIGLFFGSFLNVLADRLPFGRTLLGRSECDSCKHMLSWRDLIPLVSFIELRAKCRYCKAPMSYQYPLAEIFTGVVYVLTWILSTKWFHFPSIHVIHLIIASILIVMVLSDFRYQILPDEMQMGLFLVGLSRIFILNQQTIEMNIIQALPILGEHLLGGIAVMTPLLLIFLITRGRGMGFGDVKFAFISGFVLGALNGFIALYIGFVAGGIVGGYLLLTRKKKGKSKLAFGPYLILGYYLMMLVDAEVVFWLSKVYGF